MDNEDKKTVLISLVLVILILICFIFYQRHNIKDLKSQLGDSYTEEKVSYTNNQLQGFYQFKSEDNSDYKDTYSLYLYENGRYTLHYETKGKENASDTYVGIYTIKDNIVYLNDLVQVGKNAKYYVEITRELKITKSNNLKSNEVSPTNPNVSNYTLKKTNDTNAIENFTNKYNNSKLIEK